MQYFSFKFYRLYTFYTVTTFSLTIPLIWFFLLAVAQHAYYLHLVRMCWSKWSSVLHHRWTEEQRLQASSHLAKQSTQRRALERWKACILLKQNINKSFLFIISVRCRIVSACNYQCSCLILELINRCDAVQRRSWKKPDSKAASPSSFTGKKKQNKR